MEKQKTGMLYLVMSTYNEGANIEHWKEIQWDA